MTERMKLLLKKGGSLTRLLPVFVWLAALGGVAVLFVHQGTQVDFTGIVVAQEQAITIAEAGYIKALPVRLYEEVKKGDTLAVVEIVTIGNEAFNTELIEARRATAQAELERLKAELDAAQAELETEQVDRNRDAYEIQRRLAVDVEKAKLNILEVKTSLEPSRAQLKDMELEVRIAEKLLEDNAIAPYELQKIENECEVIRQTVVANELLLEQAEAHYAQSQLRLDEFRQKATMSASIAKRLAPVARAIVVQERLIEEIMRPRDTLVLTAPFDGVVSNLLYKPGQAVLRDIPIMVLVRPTPEYVTAWVPQSKIRQLQVDMPVRIVTRTTPVRSLQSKITHISPSVELMPEQMWQSPDLPQWGQAVLIPVQPNFGCLHNEVVGIKKIVQ
jgi:multidrug resistance efflux pump